MNNQSTFRSIFKVTSFIGSIQFIIILISIVRSKLVAILLGPVGMGIFGLLSSTIGVIETLTNFGLGTSAIKNIAEANVEEDKLNVSRVINVLKRLVWFTGLLGIIIAISFSSYLSQITFGNKDYTYAFIWLSITILFNHLASSRLVILQGLRQFKLLAKANLFGNLIGLLIVIPVYYLYHLKAIVPAIIISSAVTLIVVLFISKKLEIKQIPISVKSTFIEGKDMLFMGFFIGLTWLIIYIVSYLTRIYISHVGGLADVGLYNAGYVIIVNYVNLFFSAIVTDYYPRISSIADKPAECNKLINQQAEFGILILVPFLLFFLVFIKWIIVILYSSKFVIVSSMLQFSIFGILFFAAGNPIAYYFLAKGSKKAFFWIELIIYSLQLVLNMLFYKYLKLEGLGIAYLLFNIIYLLVYYFAAKIIFKFSFNKDFFKVFTIQLVFFSFTVFVIRNLPSPYNYLIGSALAIFSGIFSLVELNKRIDFKGIINKFLKRKGHE